MRVEIRTILRKTGDSFEFEAAGSPEEMALSFPGYEFSQPVRFMGAIRNAGNDVFVIEGVVTASWISHCARCLVLVVSQIEAQVDVSFRPQNSKDPCPGENVDPEEEYTYTGYSIGLDRALRDSLILALPFRLLCGPDCKGICGLCGQNRNEQDCGCDTGNENGTSLFEECKKLL